MPDIMLPWQVPKAALAGAALTQRGRDYESREWKKQTNGQTDPEETPHSRSNDGLNKHKAHK